jgi:hypothetical protein
MIACTAHPGPNQCLPAWFRKLQADQGITDAMVWRGTLMARALRKVENQDFAMVGSSWRAANPMCAPRGGRHYACRLVLANGNARAIRFYPTCTISTDFDHTREWHCSGGELLPWDATDSLT